MKIELEFDQEGFRVTTNEIRPPLANLGVIGSLVMVQRLRISKALNDQSPSPGSESAPLLVGTS